MINVDRKNTLYFLVTLIFLGCALEFFSLLFFHIQKDSFSFSNPGEFTLDDEEIARVSINFNSYLGWETYFKTPFGQRRAPESYEEDFMATFGDSFTFGDEVKDNETWQVYLSQLLKENIYNFGNGGYGTDQAYLRFKRDYTKIKTKYIALGLVSENINRLVNVYRRFYIPYTGIPATKPRFILENKNLLLKENPVKSLEELKKLKDTNFIQELGNSDYWYNQLRRPHFSFPFTAIFFNKHMWFEVQHGRQDDSMDGSYNHLNTNLWEEEKARKLMFAIVDRFIEETENNHSVPVILLFPLEFEVVYKKTTGRTPNAISHIITYYQNKGYTVFCPLDKFITEMNEYPDIRLFEKGGHYSAYGNNVVAKHLYNHFLKLWGKPHTKKSGATDG